MKILPLRQLLRDPKKVKMLTKNGQTVRITDDGEPLWDIMAPGGAADIESAETDARRNQLWEDHFEELLSCAGPLAGMPSVAEVLAASRGER